MANGLRNPVVEVMVGAGVTRELVTVMVPDMVLGQSLKNAPRQAPPSLQAQRDALSGSARSVQQEAPTRVTAVTPTAAPDSSGRPTSDRAAGSRAADHSRVQSKGPVAGPHRSRRRSRSPLLRRPRRHRPRNLPPLPLWPPPGPRPSSPGLTSRRPRPSSAPVTSDQRSDRSGQRSDRDDREERGHANQGGQGGAEQDSDRDRGN